jgi:hypothetical protein
MENYPKPFGINRPNEQYSRVLVSLSSEKGEISFDLEQVSIDYFPRPGKPSHIIFWHKNGVMIVDYSILECASRFNQA